jgi:LysR family glycine cleavage system transcriptional activator
MKRHFPPLNTLRAFEATARFLSFQLAAKELNVTHSAISHQIKKLEEELGQQLFQRLGRSIALTAVGHNYFIDIQKALNQIESSTYHHFGDPDKGDLIIQTYMGIASRWLVPRLGQFRKLYPDINIQLYSSYNDWEFEDNTSDLGIIYSESTHLGIEYQALFKGLLMPVCSPDFLRDNPITDLASLLACPFLDVRESPLNLNTWLKAQHSKLGDVQVVSKHDNHQLALEAASAGQGIAIVHSFFACADLANNKLVMPLDLTVDEIGQWYFVQPVKRFSDSKINYFSNWLYHQISSDQALLKAK